MHRGQKCAHAAASIFAASLAATATISSAQSINLQFNGSGNTLAATGFDAVYNIDPTKFNVGGGKLSIMTQPGDTFGDYENEPDSAKNMFYSNVASPPTRTVIESKITITDLNADFHGGGLWMGTDQDHYLRLGVINNHFENGVDIEGLRENEDLWPNPPAPRPGGPGNDIQGVHHGLGITTPLENPLDIVLRIIRDGTPYGFWRPQVQKLEAAQLPRRLESLAPKGWLHVRLTVQQPDSQGFGLAGSGVFVINPPYTLHAELIEVMPYLTEVLGQYDGANYLLEQRSA